MPAWLYFRGLNNYLYFFWGFLTIGISTVYHNGPQNPSLIIKAPVLRSEGLVFGVWDFKLQSLSECEVFPNPKSYCPDPQTQHSVASSDIRRSGSCFWPSEVDIDAESAKQVAKAPPGARRASNRLYKGCLVLNRTAHTLRTRSRNQ